VGVVAGVSMFHSMFGASRKREMSAVFTQITLPTLEEKARKPTGFLGNQGILTNSML